MQNQTKRRVSPDELDALLRSSAGIGCRVNAELIDVAFWRRILDHTVGRLRSLG